MSAFIIRCASIAFVGIGIAVGALGSTTTPAEAFYYSRAHWNQAYGYNQAYAYAGSPYYTEYDRNVSSPLH